MSKGNLPSCNDLQLRKVHLCKVKNSKDLCCSRRKSYGVCGVNCNLRHNLHSNMNLRSRVGEPIHWPHQNYEIDHVANVGGRVCGCGEEWNKNKTNDLILNLTPENITQHSRIVTTTCKGSSTPTKMSKIIGRQIH